MGAIFCALKVCNLHSLSCNTDAGMSDKCWRQFSGPDVSLSCFPGSEVNHTFVCSYEDVVCESDL